MKTDLKLIKELVEEIKIRLKQRGFEDIMDFQNRGFATDEKGEVVGLNLDKLQLDLVPAVLSQFRHLKKLSLVNTKLEDISFLLGLSNLTDLNLRNNQIADISSLKGLSNLTTLDLGGNQITDISALPWLSNLTELNLGNNRITDISFLHGLSNLTTLDLGGNQITDFSSLQGLSNLTTLYLGDNQITDISSLQGLSNLTYLNLGSNQITDISSLQGLSNLTSLKLMNNKITDISPLQGLTQLKHVNLWGNNIRQLPEAIIELDLELDVDSNEAWTDDKKIHLWDNPLETPPPEIIRKGKEAIRAYFASLKAETLPLNEVKILLVGDGGAGKTSLAKQLLGKSFNKKETKTDGININYWHIPANAGGTKTKVNLWDFGGQEVMHATHQFFLSQRSLYILVLDGRRDEKTEYWLNHIKSFGGNSPVMIVLNKIDQNPGFDVNRLFLQNKYPNIKGFFPISCATKAGIKEFAAALSKELSEVEHIRTQWAASWFKVKKRLETMTQHYISAQEYDNFCAAENITEDYARQTLLDFLHDLGVALHFQELSLTGIHVLDPQWITNAVYKIINSPLLADCKGILNLSLLDKILVPKDKKDYVYPRDKYSFIIDLMRKFELCYEMDDQRVLVPELLGIGEPPLDFDFTQSLKFRVEYEFLPRSVMPRFIVKRHKEIKDDLRWRTGVVLENTDFAAAAVVKVDERDKTIFIDVFGSQKRDYLATIIHTLRDIHASFEAISPDERVPLPDNPGVTVSYRHLLRLDTMKEKSLVPEGAARPYNVIELLDGIKPPAERQKEVEQLQKEGKFQIDFRPEIVFSPTLYTQQNQVSQQFQQNRQDVALDVDVDVDIEVNIALSLELPNLQADFDDLKELLIRQNPELKEKLTELGDSLDQLSPKSKPEQLNAPMNKLGRFLKKLGDDKSDLGKILKGGKKCVDALQKVGKTYNKIAQWLALPQVPDLFLK